jgi:hypothetical protein
VPLYYECDPAARRVTVTSMGAVGLDEALEVIDRQAADGAWSYGLLYDVRLGASAPSEDDVQRMVMHVGSMTIKRGPRGPVAFVVADPELLKMGSRYARLGDLTALTVRVFTRIEDAEQWLGTRSAGR